MKVSRKLFERAQRVIPAGVNSPVRAFRAVGGTPPFIERGKGARIWDADGRAYIDYVGSWGPLVVGHGHPKVVKAAQRAAARGLSFGAPTEQETELAELLCRLVPSLELVRLVSSGTEATMSAIRLARGVTGRDVIVKFAGNYHGHVDSLLVAAGSSAATLAVPNSPGVTAGTSRDTLVLQYNNVTGVRDAFARHGERIAGVIFEPIVGNMGVVVRAHVEEVLLLLDRDIQRLRRHFGRALPGGGQPFGHLRGRLADVVTVAGEAGRKRRAHRGVVLHQQDGLVTS